MRVRFTKICAFLAVLIFAASASADIANPGGPRRPRPRPAENDEAGSIAFAIHYQPGAKVSRLVLPPEAIPDSNDAKKQAAPAEGAGASPMRTIVAGLAMSAAIVGLFFVRRTNRKVQSMTAAGVFLAAIAGTSAVVWGNAAPPPMAEGSKPAADEGMRAIPALAPLVENRRVVVEIGKKGDPVTLYLATPNGNPFDDEPSSPFPEQTSGPAKTPDKPQPVNPFADPFEAPAAVPPKTDK